MTVGELFDADADDTETALMAATYRALCEHGYADLTIEKIGESFEKSPSLLYHHYDGMDELLLEFLDAMLEAYESAVPLEDIEDPWQRLLGVLDHVLGTPTEPEAAEFASAMIELRAQAAHDEQFRAAFTRHDEFFRERLRTILADGVEQGQFEPVDPAAVATLLQTTLTGAMLQRVTTDDSEDGVQTAVLREELEASLESRLDPGGAE